MATRKLVHLPSLSTHLFSNSAVSKMANNDSDYDSEIADLNEGGEPELSIEDRAKPYEKDGMKRIIKLWARYVVTTAQCFIMLTL